MKERALRRRAKRLHILTSGKRPDVLIGPNNAIYTSEPETERPHVRCENPGCMLFSYHEGHCLLREPTDDLIVGTCQRAEA